MKITFGLFLVLSLFTFATAQDAHPNQWKGLTLDISSASQAIEKFGKPKSDKVDSVRIFEINSLLTKDLKKKQWRILNYSEIETAKDIVLIFNPQDKLVMVRFTTKDLKPQAVVNSYGIPFKPMFSGLDMAFNPKDLARDSNGNLYAKSYPTVYSLIGSDETSFVVASVGNSSFGSIFKKSMGVQDTNYSYPGNVFSIELVSRTLENKDNTNVLK